MNNRYIAFAMAMGLLVFLIFSQNLNAEPLPKYRLQIDETVNEVYKPFSGQPLQKAFYVRLENETGNTGSQTDPAKAYNLVINSKITQQWFLTSPQGQQLPFRFKSQDLKELLFTNNEYSSTLNLKSILSEPVQQLLYFTINPSLFAKPGKYSLELQFKLVDKLSGELAAEAKPVTFHITVEPRLQVNLARKRSLYQDGLSYVSIDFGELKAGATEKLFIQVRGNTQANIKVSSENNGRMKHEEHNNLFINYFVNVDGVRSELAEPLHIVRSLQQDMNGSSFPMAITLGENNKGFAGTYRDTIVIDVTPQ